ncbi:sigma E protease regulator RseP [Sodalis endosymbiont of Henestaris halophilus]|uniref:sigma E protease regulator RseP n=1 Tax=Sodalis endosymbiont of Henestaris halophilus TaxID=1929246 RepID=UPI000BC09CFC|nr:sigma E protease regulator RseP [Sodalis endosymbiont of Henestaris halophilus]SNC58315.1 Regulator of sigma-E protease RseP [Sodalis endosymbiont of Henestaris halophilus]
MMYFLWSLATFIVALGLLITVHECGHFLVARCCGVTVERFSIGFGHALWRWRYKRGTEYVIATIPLGGYIKMLDERVNTVAPERRCEAYNHKTVEQRAAIIAAGPLFNFLFAIFAYWLVFLIGVPINRPVIGEVAPNSIAAQAKLYPGMELQSVDGIETPDWDSIRMQLINKIGDHETTFGVAPFGSAQRTQKKLDLRCWHCEPNKQDAIIALGILPLGPRIEPVLTEVQPDSAAMKAGLQAGDKIVKVDGQPVESWQFFVTEVRNHPDQPLLVGIERLGSALDIILRPASKPVGKGQIEGFAGIVPKIIPLPSEYKTVRQYGPLSALSQASKKTWQLMKITGNMLSKLITGNIKLKNLSGPISIAQGAGMTAKCGLIYYLMFLALISVNLGIINLFPLPVLDGGHLLFLVIEKLKGEPVSERIQYVSDHVGSILIVLLMGLALFNDFCKL